MSVNDKVIIDSDIGKINKIIIASDLPESNDMTLKKLSNFFIFCR